jgi:hypothetical protein
MIFSVTGINYLLMALAFAIIALRCFELIKNRKGQLAKLFAYFFTLFSIISGIFGVLSTFRLEYTSKTSIFIDILFAFACGFLAYLIIYFNSPRINPLLGFIPVFLLGIFSAFIDLHQGHPKVLDSGEIEWGLPPIGYLSLFSLFLVSFSPMIYILFQCSKNAQNKFFKIKYLLFALVGFCGLLVCLSELIIEPFLNLEKTPLNEVVLITSNMFLYTFLLTSIKDFKNEN